MQATLTYVFDSLQVNRCDFYVNAACCIYRHVSLQASHSYVSTNWNSYYAGRKESTDPCPRCCLAEECIQKDKGRYTILTTLRTDKYLPLLQVSICQYDMQCTTSAAVITCCTLQSRLQQQYNAETGRASFHCICTETAHLPLVDALNLMLHSCGTGAELFLEEDKRWCQLDHHGCGRRSQQQHAAGSEEARQSAPGR